MKEIQLTQGKVVLVDDEDYERVNQLKWHVFCSKGQWTAIRHFGSPKGRRKIPMSRFIMNTPMSLVVDHINNDSLDNRKCNLRPCSQRQNTYNKSRVAKYAGTYRGVSKKGDCNRWEASIANNAKKKYLGLYKSVEDAARAYDKAATLIYGEFANLNFPLKSRKTRDLERK